VPTAGDTKLGDTYSEAMNEFPANRGGGKKLPDFTVLNFNFTQYSNKRNAQFITSSLYT
jgi:hypothetical protein